jgi:Na+/H+-dicarboxylate symporter
MGRDRQPGKRKNQRSRIQQWCTIKITIMKKSTWKEIIRIIVTVLTALLTALGAQSCTATMSVFWKNANSQQKSEQSATNKVDSINTNINLKR